MDTVSIVLLVIMAVLLVAYVGRRRSRLKREED
jgi:hypothetical protein